MVVKPKYNFIYAAGNGLYDYNIQVVNGRVTVESKFKSYPNSSSPYPLNVSPSYPDLFLYDVVHDKSKQITLAQAQSYVLDPSDKSPDGFKVGWLSNSGSLLFVRLFGGDRGVYLYGNGKGIRRRIADYYSIKFIGWVINE